MGNSPFHDWPGFYFLSFLVLPIFSFLPNRSPLFRALFNAMVDYLALYPAIYIYGPMCNVHTNQFYGPLSHRRVHENIELWYGIEQHIHRPAS